MNHRSSIGRLMLMIVGAAVSSVALGGCSSATRVSFTNVSDTWLRVSYYVSAPPTAEAGVGPIQEPAVGPEPPTTFLSDRVLQVGPGQNINYALGRNPNFSREDGSVVHIKVEPVKPTWETGKAYWLELLTPPPARLVATGSADNLQLLCGSGEIKPIPKNQLRASAYESSVAQVPTK